jgi:4-hydroxybenzoate polyprenyltransferase
LGETVADYKLAATARAFNDRYEQGIRSLFVAVDPKGDRKKGSELAAILLEERRKTLLAVSIRFTGYSFGLSLVGCMVGLQPLQLPLVCVPATVAAIIQSKN